MSNELEAFIEYITINKGLSSATIDAYRSDLTSMEVAIELPMININQTTALNHLMTIENRRTLNRKLSSMNAFYAFCYEKEYIQKNQKFRLSKLPKSLPHYLEIDQIRKGLLVVDKTKWLGLRDYAFILFLFATGLRVSEALQVERSDIDENWVKVRFAKGEKERLVPIAQEALNALERYLDATPTKQSFLWQNYTGKILSRVTAFKITQKYLNVSPHVLRHSYATALILGGADLRVVQDLLGHASMLTTQIYTHIEKAVLRDTVLRHHPLLKEHVFENSLKGKHDSV